MLDGPWFGYRLIDPLSTSQQGMGQWKAFPFVEPENGPPEDHDGNLVGATT
jgi:hypothetical protein